MNIDRLPSWGTPFPWHGFTGRVDLCHGRTLRIIAPQRPGPGLPWIWKTEFLDAFPATEKALLARGFHLVHLEIPDFYGAPEAVEAGNALHELVTGRFGFAPKVALTGLSRGGLLAYNWAIQNPQKVLLLYGDNPVCDFRSWPGGLFAGPGSAVNWRQCLERYGLDEAAAREWPCQPVDRLAPLAAAGVPILHVIGDADETVPVAENSHLVRERYRALGGRFEEIVKPGGRHHPHGLPDDPAPIVDFFLKAAYGPESHARSLLFEPGAPPAPEPPPLWHSLRHPCLWLNEDDLPRLRENARHPFWEPKFRQWREELRGLERLAVGGDRIDFHTGTNTLALKAALCYVVDDDPHYGRLIASYLGAVAAFYRESPDWRAIMCTNGNGCWTGNQWGGLSGSHIVDPQLWISTAHLYDVIFGKGFLSREDAATFEEMMALFHQLGALHEEMLKLDNNRSIWLVAGSYVSSLFDRDAARARLVRERMRGRMPRFLSTILPDGVHYEIGGYGPGSLAALHVFARCIRGAEGIDWFAEKSEGVGFEEAFRAWAGLLIPGSSLRFPCGRDRMNHWDAFATGWSEYRIPEVGWALGRMGERSWVPMFRHWPQGFEFYTWSDPGPQPPPLQTNHLFPDAGIAILRTGWEDDAASLYFRYGFQGSSHGGGLDKLNFELTWRDEALIADPLLSEFSGDKNVVLVDGVCQQACSGRLLYRKLEGPGPLRYVSALGGLGEWPEREFLHDPCAEVNYWMVKKSECFPGVARMRRTVVQLPGPCYLIRDTLEATDCAAHEYEWLFHTFLNPAAKPTGERLLRTLRTQPIWHSQGVSRQTRRLEVLPLAGNRLHLDDGRTALGIEWVARGAALPETLGLSRAAARYAYAGSPETGDGFSEKMISRLHLILPGRDVALTTLLTPGASPNTANTADTAPQLSETPGDDLNRGRYTLRTAEGEATVLYDEAAGHWEWVPPV